MTAAVSATRAKVEELTERIIVIFAKKMSSLLTRPRLIMTCGLRFHRLRGGPLKSICSAVKYVTTDTQMRHFDVQTGA